MKEWDSKDTYAVCPFCGRERCVNLHTSSWERGADPSCDTRLWKRACGKCAGAFESAKS